MGSQWYWLDSPQDRCGSKDEKCEPVVQALKESWYQGSGSGSRRDWSYVKVKGSGGEIKPLGHLSREAFSTEASASAGLGEWSGRLPGAQDKGCCGGAALSGRAYLVILRRAPKSVEGMEDKATRWHRPGEKALPFSSWMGFPASHRPGPVGFIKEQI